MIRGRPCFGFSSDAERQYRNVSDELIVEIRERCSSLCAGCRGHREEPLDPVTVAPWTLTLSCGTGRYAAGCGNHCRVVITDIARNGG